MKITKTCGICESRKASDEDGHLRCPHCDIPCANRACTICRQGMKGLSEVK